MRVIYCNPKITIDLVFKDMSRMILTNKLYILGLGVNLLLGRRIYETGLIDQYTKSHMYLKQEKDKIITAMK
jgi:hypothetical protein